MRQTTRRVYEGLFAFNCAAALVCAFFANHVHDELVGEKLLSAAVLFGFSACAFRLGLVKVK